MTMRHAIGGFFELELSATGAFPHQQAHRYRSARTAFRALLQARRPTRVWMPRYICDSMIAPIVAEHIPYALYDLTDTLDIQRNIDVAAGEIILYVNYFGIADRHIDAILADFGPDKVVLDHSQALFSPPRPCLATIYSPRKFVGVPDGGLLCTTAPVAPAATTTPGGVDGLAHLVGRIVDGPERHYDAFVRHEDTFDDLGASAMSDLSTRVLRSIDWDHTARARIDNFAVLDRLLGATNALSLRLAPGAVPLCYPYLHSRAPALRAALLKERVYTPVYWKEVLTRCAAGAIESRLTNDLIALPCDQRYGSADMDHIASLIKAAE